MTPVVNGGLAIYYPTGFLDGNNSQTMFELNYLRSLKPRGIRAVVVTFEKVIYFNKVGVQYIHDILEKISKEDDIVVGFVSYTTRHYELLIKMIKNIGIHLFENNKIMRIITSGVADINKALVWHEDQSHKNNLVAQLRARGIEPIIAKNRDDFLEKEKDEYELVLKNTILHHMSNKFTTGTHGNIVLYSMAGYIDNNFKDNFDMEYHLNSLRIGFKVYILDATNVVSINIAGMKFLMDIALSLTEYGGSFIIAGFDVQKLSDAIIEELELYGIIMEDNLEEAIKKADEYDSAGATSAAKQSKSITKKMVENLPEFVNATMITIETMTGMLAKKESVKMSEFNILEDDKKYLGSSIGFYGDMDGVIMLFFPENLAKKACSLLLGEDVNSDMVLDTLGEFVNIIGGQAKLNLSNNDIDIKITLPRTFKDRGILNDVVEGKKGVLATYKFEEDIFYFFLTR